MGYKFLSKKYWNMSNPLGDTVELEEALDDILNLSIGDPDLNTHIKIIAGAFEDAENCMKNLNESICFSASSVSSVSQRAGIYALKYRKEFQANIVKEYRDRVIYAYNRINQIKGIHAVKTQGAIYVFVNIKNIGLNSVDFASRLLKEKQVQVIPGTVFGSEGEGYLRIACTYL